MTTCPNGTGGFQYVYSCIIDKPFSLDTGEAHVKKLREKGLVQENDIAVVVESQSDEFGRQ